MNSLLSNWGLGSDLTHSQENKSRRFYWRLRVLSFPALLPCCCLPRPLPDLLSPGPGAWCPLSFKSTCRSSWKGVLANSITLSICCFGSYSEHELYSWILTPRGYWSKTQCHRFLECINMFPSVHNTNFITIITLIKGFTISDKSHWSFALVLLHLRIHESTNVQIIRGQDREVRGAKSKVWYFWFLRKAEKRKGYICKSRWGQVCTFRRAG